MNGINVELAYYNNDCSVPLQNDYELNDLDKLCFSCSLETCTPGKNCPREIAKSKK